MSFKRAAGSALFISVVSGVLSLSLLSWADDTDSSPQWCAKAKTQVEKLVCQDGTLENLDREMGVYYEHLLKLVGPDARVEVVESQRKWITEREQCTIIAKQNRQDVEDCVSAKLQLRSNLLQKKIDEQNIEKRLSEFATLKLKTFKGSGFEFQYPNSWHLEMRKDGRISVKSKSEEMILGFEKTETSLRKCTYFEEGTPQDEIRKSFYQGKKQIGGHDFDSFRRGWLPSGEDRHYYGFFNGRCFAVHVSDNSEAAGNCGRIDDGKERAECNIFELEAKDLMAYSNGVINTLHFLSDQK